MPILDAQHFLAVVLVASAFAPQFRRLQRGHQHFDGAGAVLFLAHDAADLAQHPVAQGQEGVDAGRLLADHARPQHEPMRDDLGFLGGLAQDRQEIPGESHGRGQFRRAGGMPE